MFLVKSREWYEWYLVSMTRLVTPYFKQKYAFKCTNLQRLIKLSRCGKKIHKELLNWLLSCFIPLHSATTQAYFFNSLEGSIGVKCSYTKVHTVCTKPTPLHTHSTPWNHPAGLLEAWLPKAIWLVTGSFVPSTLEPSWPGVPNPRQSLDHFFSFYPGLYPSLSRCLPGLKRRGHLEEWEERRWHGGKRKADLALVEVGASKWVDIWMSGWIYE